MKTEYTDRGFAVISFLDCAGTECSLQESSVATDDLIWLGPDGTGNRMHLDRARTMTLMAMMKSLTERHGAIRMASFTEVNGRRCVASNDQAGNIRIVMANEPAGAPMILDAEICRELIDHLEVFIAHGQLETVERLYGSEQRHLSIKIPASSLDDTDVGGTGIALRDLIDAFVDLASGDATDARKAEIAPIVRAMTVLRNR